MKRIIIPIISLLASGTLALAQGGPGPGGGTNAVPNSWSNYFSMSNQFLWGTNCLALTNAPKAWSNHYQRTISGPANNDGTPVRNRFGQQPLPDDVQTAVQQFQQDRTRLMDQLRTASDQQRQQILQDMEQQRIHLRDQVRQHRETAQQQAEQMREKLGNNRDRMLQQGAATQTGTGRDR
jgi:hypothetical protein